MTKQITIRDRAGTRQIPLEGEILPPVRHESAPLPMPALPSPPAPLVLPPATHTAHMRENFDAINQAKATLMHAKADMRVFGVITVAVVFLIWLMRGGDLLPYGLGGLLVWGSVSLYALNRNRAQTYHHSPAGVAHHELSSQNELGKYEIDSRERIALHGIDRSTEIIKAHYGLTEVVDANRTARR